MPEGARNEVFRPAFWTILGLLALLLGAIAVLRGFPATGWLSRPGMIAGFCAAALGTSWLFTQALWSFSDRSRFVFQFILLGIWGSFLLSGLLLAREVQLAHDRRMVEEVNEARLALRQRAIEQAKQALAETEERRRRLEEDRFARYEDRVDAETLDRMRAADSEIVESMQAAADRYRSVLAANPTRGPEAWLRISNREELEKERQHTQAIYESSRAYVDFLNGLAQRYQAKLDELALDSPADRYAVAEMERLLQTWDHSGAQEIRELDVAISTISLRALDLLREHWGQWHFDRANSRVIFENPGHEMAFIQLLREAAQMVSEQERLRRRYERLSGAAGNTG